MSSHDILTDDYVAGLLAKEAKDCSLKYSAIGLEAFRQDKKPAQMPKPNTRFLRHIIEDTNAHNKALLAREASESKARLEDLEHAEEIKRLKMNPDACDIRRRQMGDIRAILGGKKRQWDGNDGRPDSGRASHSRDQNGKRPRDEGFSKRGNELLKDGFDDARRHGRLDGYDDKRRDSSPQREERRNPKRPRVDGPASEEGVQHRHGRPRRDRSKSPRRKRSRSPRLEKRKHRKRSRHRSPPKDVSGWTRKSAEAGRSSDSDPLDDLIGPAPPPRHRGRGTIGGAASLDRRFSESYDPRTDVRSDGNDEDDLDDAVEAFRDRQKLRQHQERRVRDAGFAEEQIRKATDGADKTEKDVVWSRPGEKRAWDQGKVLAEEMDEQPTLFSEAS